MERYQSPQQSQHRGTPTERGETRQSQTGMRQSQMGAQQSQTTHRPRTYRTAVGLPDETRHAVVEMLNQSLADATDLMTQAKFAHWNVKGMNFYQLHLLFDEIAETLNEHVDVIAERATALGGEATGTVRVAASESCIPEILPDATTGPEYVAALVERVGIHANNLRADIEAAMECGDQDTADMYTEISREVDKHLYFLEAHLQAVEPDAIPDSPGGSMPSEQSQGGNPSQYRQSETETGQMQQDDVRQRQTQGEQIRQGQTGRGQTQGGRMPEDQMWQGQTRQGRTRQAHSYGRQQWEQWG